MKKLLFLSTLIIILAPGLVSGDGVIFPDYTEKVYLPSQKAVISWDGQEENMILSTKIKMETIANAAWIVPIPSKIKPEIEKGNIEIFYDLADLFGREERAPGFGTIEKSEQVEVIEFKKVDIYDITTLKATDAQSLIEWLNKNGYLVPESAISVLEEYCRQEDFYFIANKINLTNKYKNFVITEEDKLCAKEFNDYYGFRRDIYEEEMPWIAEQLKSCQKASFEPVKVLIELERGIATPIMIKFQPLEPFYPLKISSINDGATDIDVYLFSETPVKDRSGILSVSQMTKNTSFFKDNHGLDQKYITYLTFSGYLSELNADSWFEAGEYDAGLDPYVVSFWDRFWQIFPVLARAMYYIVLPAILLLVLAGLIYAAKKIITKIRKK